MRTLGSMYIPKLHGAFGIATELPGMIIVLPRPWSCIPKLQPARRPFLLHILGGLMSKTEPRHPPLKGTLWETHGRGPRNLETWGALESLRERLP